MTDILQIELQRARWRRTLERFAIDRDDREDFAAHGLASRLRTITVQLMLLPSDPEAAPVKIDDDLAVRFQGGHNVTLDHLQVELPRYPRRTAQALAVSDPYDDSSWTGYCAIHRSGALEFGLGDHGGYDRIDHQGGASVRTIYLTPTVARAWALLVLAGELYRDDHVSGPFQLTVAVKSTKGALLGMLGEGWAEPGGLSNRSAPCRDHHLLWHLELDEIPDRGGARGVAYAIGDRMEDAWGSAGRRYLAYRGDFAGQLDPRRV